MQMNIKENIDVLDAQLLSLANTIEKIRCDSRQCEGQPVVEQKQLDELIEALSEDVRVFQQAVEVMRGLVP